MLTEFQKRKLTALFHRQDMDHDGFVGKGDYEQYAKRFCEVQGYAPDSPQCQAAYAQNMAIWEQVRQVADKDGDNRVSLEEFLHSYDITLNDDKVFEQLVTQFGQAMLALWDRDGDGRLSRVEWAALLGCYGIGEEALRETYAHIDPDGRGYLALEELMERVKEFYRSEDPDAPGNWLLGPY